MSLDKAIKSGKEKRKIYRKGKAVSKNCRNSGNCPYCVENRTYQERKELASAAERENFVETE